MEHFRLAQTLSLWDWWQENNCELLENEKFLQVENLRGETWKSQRLPLPMCFSYAHKPLVRTCEFIVFHALIPWSPRRAAAPAQGEEFQSQCKLCSLNHSDDAETVICQICRILSILVIPGELSIGLAPIGIWTYGFGRFGLYWFNTRIHFMYDIHINLKVINQNNCMFISSNSTYFSVLSFFHKSAYL